MARDAMRGTRRNDYASGFRGGADGAKLAALALSSFDIIKATSAVAYLAVLCERLHSRHDIRCGPGNQILQRIHLPARRPSPAHSILTPMHKDAGHGSTAHGHVQFGPLFSCSRHLHRPLDQRRQRRRGPACGRVSVTPNWMYWRAERFGAHMGQPPGETHGGFFVPRSAKNTQTDRNTNPNTPGLATIRILKRDRPAPFFLVAPAWTGSSCSERRIFIVPSGFTIRLRGAGAGGGVD